MKPPTYYSKRVAELELEYDQYRDDGDQAQAAATTKSIHKIKREIRKMLNRETDSNDEATATQRFDDSDKRYNEYYTANWVLFFAMLGVGGGTYFRRNNI